MKHLKRTVSLCLTLLMILGCLPNLSLTASAANYGVWVLGTRVTDANKGDVLGDGTVSYNPAYQTLYLHDLGLIDASEDNYNSSAIYSNGSLTLVLDGYSAFTGAGFGVRVVGDLYIHGDGRLALSAADSGIYAGGCLYLDDTVNVPTVSANGSFYGVRVKSAALLQGTLNALTYGMNEDANATIKNAGIYTYSGALHLGSSDPRCFRNNVHLNAESQNGPAVYAEGRIELSPVLNITQPAEWHLSGDLRTVQDGSDSQATKVLLEPLPSYQITAEAYQGEVVVDQGDRAFVGTTVTISFRPEEDLSLMFLACEDPDDSTPVPVTRDGDSYTFIMPAHNVFIYAEFGDEPGYAVLVDEAMEHGTVSAEQPLYLPGNSVALTVTPEDSYFLRTIRVVNNDDNSEIEITGSGSDWEFEMPEANVTVYASFAQAANSVTLTPNPGCTLYTDRDNTMPGDTVIISAIPAAGWKFNDLIVTDANANEVLTLRSGNEYTFTMPNSAVTVTAACSQASYSITVQNGSNGSASVNHTEAGYGETVTVTASADSGYRTLVTVTNAFGESVPLEQTGTDTYRFSMPACDVTVLTQSDPTYAITVESSEHGSITASVSQAAAGDRVTLTITPDEGYVFVGTITPQRRDNYEEFTLQDDNSFIMPDSDVLVKVTRTAFSIAGAYDLWLGSTQVTDLNRTDILNNGQASFDPETNVLTLNNLTGTEGGGDYNASIYSGLPKLTILGSGSIQGLNGNNQNRGIYIDGDLVLDGDFTIAGTSNGITNKNQGNVTLWGGTINITGGTRGIYLTPGTLTIRDGIEQVHISGGSQAVSASSGITLESDVQITSPANCVVDGRYFMVGEDKATSVTLSNISNNPRIILLPTAHGTVTADKQRAAAGETVTLTITPDAGYLVGSTYIHAGNTTPPQSDDLHFTMLSTDVTVEVQFVRPSVAVQITAGAHGSVSDQTNSFSDPAGTVKTVDCTPDADYRVDRLVVSGTQDEIPMLSLTTDEFGVSHFTFALPNTDTNATLLFTLQERPVTVIRNSNGTIQADVTEACTGDTVTLSAAANENYKFIGFCVKDQSGSDVVVTKSGESWQFTMPASPVTVTGWFDPAVAYDLYVAGVQVIGLNKDDVLGDGKVSYDPDTQTLTLNGVTGASGSYHSAGVFTNSLDSLTVVSTNSSFASIGEAIAGTYAGPVYGILAENTDVTLQGDLVCSTGCGIVARNVTLASGRLDLPRLGTFTHDMGIRTGTLTISNAFSSLTMTIQGPAMMLDCDSIVLGQGQALIVPSDAEIGTVNHSANYSELTILPANLHTVTVADSIYGSVGVEKTSYYAGQLVRLTRQPDEDFEITALHVKDAENNDVTVETGDQFTMPDSDVTVTADYRYTGSSKSYDVWIGSTRVTTSNMFNVLSDGKIQYNPSTKTLHLNGVEEFKTTTHDTYGTPIEGVFCMIWSKNDLTVEGTGTFRFTGTVPSTASVSADAIVPIECGGTLTLRGDFTMTGGYHCIQAANVRLEGGIITLTNNYDRYNRSIETNGTLTLGPKLERLEINSNRYVFDAGSVSMHRYLRVVDPAGKTISQLNSNANYKHLLVERYDQPVEIHSTNGTVTANVETEVSGQTVTLTLTPDAGCILQSLTVTDESGSPIALRYWDDKADFTMPATKAVVTAVFVSGTHSVTLAEPIHGSLSVERFAYAPGETVTVTAEPETGYALTSLDVFAAKGATQKITDTKQFVMPDSDVTVVATYDMVYYPVTVTESAHGSVTASADTVTWGDTVQLSVFPDEDYELQSMTVQDANNNNVTVTNNSFVMPASAVTVSAVFTEIKYHVSCATVAFGSISADKTTVLPGETVTLTATPDEGYALERLWIADTGGSEIPMLSDTTFTMPKMDVVVHATFTAVDYRISTEVSGHGTVRPTVSTANFGQTVTVIAEPETGYVLSSLAVVKAGGGKVDVNARTFGMPSDDVIIRAVFVPQGEENTAYNLWLGDTQVTNANAADILGNGGTSFDPETNTLTLNNPGNWVAGHTALNHKQLIYSENMDLTVKGRANLSTSNERGIYASGGTLTLDGDLQITSFYEALWANHIVIAGGTAKITTTGAFSAIRGDTGLRFENGIVSMEAAGGSGKTAISSGSLYIGDDLAVTNPAGGSHDGSAIYNADGSAYTGSVLMLERRADFAVRIGETEHGSVTADPARGNENEQITLTVTPDTGYQLGTLTVTDSAGTELSVDENLTFTMPAGEVHVSASFVPLDYAVNLADSEHGHVTTDKSSAHYKEEVTLTVHPDTGYRLSGLLVDGEDLLENAPVTPDLTALHGNRVGGGEEYYRLVDGDTQTRWYPNEAPSATNPYIVFKASAPICLTEYTLTEAHDLAQDPGSRWKSWTIYGANFESDSDATQNSDAWQVVTTVVDDTHLQPVNCATATYALDEPAARYQYYKIVVNASQGSSRVRMGEFSMRGLLMTPHDEADPNYTFTMPAANVTVTAEFAAIDYLVAIDENLEHVNVTAPETAHYGDRVQLSAAPDAGWRLSGFTVTDADGNNVQMYADNSFTMPAKNVTVSAQLSPIDYTISVTAATNGSVSAPATAHAGDEIALTVTPSEGYRLLTLTVTDLSGNPVTVTNNTFTMPAASVIVSASFVSEVHTIAVLPSTNGTVTASVSSAAPGATVTLTVTPDAGYRLNTLRVFDFNYHTVEVTDNAFTMPDGNVFVTASFVYAPYSVTVNVTGSGAVTPDKSAARAGETVTMTVTPDEGWKLLSLTATDADGMPVAVENNCFIMPASDVELQASFVPVDSYRVTVAPTANGTVQTNQQTAQPGETVTLTVLPDAGYRLSGLWAGDVNLLETSLVPTLTYLSGSANGTENGNTRMLVDGNIETKWYSPMSASPYIIFKASVPFRLTDYTLTTAEDTANFGRRNWQDWTIYGANFASDDEAVLDSEAWQIVESVTDDTTLQAVNLTPFTFTLNEAASVYQYYKIVVTASRTGQDMQMAELSMRGNVQGTPDVTDTLWTFTMPASDVTVTAEFEAIDYTVTVIDADNGSVSADLSSARVGDTVTLTVTPAEGYELETLTVSYGDNQTVDVENNQFTMPAADVTVTATFVAEQEPVTYTYFVGQSLTLEGDIGINFYVKLNDVEPANAKVVFTWGNNQSLTVLPGDLTADSYGRYKLTVRVAAAEMNDTVTAKLYNGETEVATKQYSVAQYARYVLSASDETLLALVGGNATKAENLRALCKAMLIYGAKSQLQFKYHTYALADQGLAYTLDPVGELGTTVFPEDFGTTTGLKYAGSSLVLESQTTYRLYFTVTDQAKLDSLTVKLGTDTLTYGIRGSYIYFDIANIPAANVLKDFTLTFGDITVTANAGEYMTKVFANSDQTLQDVMTALYWYSIAAKTFFGVN